MHNISVVHLPWSSYAPSSRRFARNEVGRTVTYLNVLSVRRPDIRACRLEGWERGLAVLWLAQATSALRLSFVFPLIPLFIQELGRLDRDT